MNVLYPKRRLTFGLKHTVGPKAKEISAELTKRTPGSPVYVEKDITGIWERFCTCFQFEGETVVVQVHRGKNIPVNIISPVVKS